MPILLPSDPSRPLDQGDILAGITVSRARLDAPPKIATPAYVMVMSRACCATRDEHIIVAPIKSRSLDALNQANSPKELIAYFKEIRDGEGTPDSFYLGSIPAGSSTRYVARLDELYGIEVPTDTIQRAAFINHHRKYQLDPSFVRDLHLRIFRAFSSLGFDDDDWWPDEDLSHIIEVCDAKLIALKAKKTATEEELKSRAVELRVSGEGSSKSPGSAELQQIDARIKRYEKESEPLRQLLAARRQAQKP